MNKYKWIIASILVLVGVLSFIVTLGYALGGGYESPGFIVYLSNILYAILIPIGLVSVPIPNFIRIIILVVWIYILTNIIYWIIIKIKNNSLNK